MSTLPRNRPSDANQASDSGIWVLLFVNGVVVSAENRNSIAS